MAGIRGKNTKPEILLRKALHRRGFRYGLHCSNVAGKPDMVFPAYHAVIFVHGCFWHGHSCRFFRLPSTRRDFWRQKIKTNRKRDRVVSAELRQSGWRQLVVWECAIRGKSDKQRQIVANRAAAWLRSRKALAVIMET